jgi:hypothetical protein
MEDVTYSEGKLHVGASWYRLSKINEVTVKKSVAIGDALWAVIMATPFVMYGFDYWTHHFWFWLVLAAAFVSIACRLMTRSVRVFVCMESGKFPVAKIVANNFAWRGIKVADAERRARELAEEIRANMPNRA